MDCFTPLALAAAWTEKLQLGTAIANVYTRSPLTLAMSANAIAEAAPGRFALGFGAGSSVIVEQWSGVPFELPYRKVRDVDRTRAAGVRRREGRRRARDGEASNGFRLSRRLAPPPPMYIAALRERMLQLAGAESDGRDHQLARRGGRAEVRRGRAKTARRRRARIPQAGDRLPDLRLHDRGRRT